MTEGGHVNKGDRIEKSLRAMIQNMVRDEVPMVSMLCNHDMLKEMIDEFDKHWTRKMAKKFEKAESKNANKDIEHTRIDVVEAYSPPRMAAMAAKSGFN